MPLRPDRPDYSDSHQKEVLVVLALGDSLRISDSLFALSFTALIMIIPISVAGLGIREISLVVTLTTAGVSSSEAAAAAILTRLYIWIISLLGAGWFLAGKRISS